MELLLSTVVQACSPPQPGRAARHPVSRQYGFSTDALALRGSVSEARLTELGARKIFDRTSLNLAVWLPVSEQAGGEPAIWPNSPPIPVPGVEHLSVAQPKAA